MSSEYYLPSKYLHILIDRAERAGLPKAEVYHALDIDPDAMNSSDPIDEDLYVACYRFCCEKLQDEFFGMQFFHGAPIGSLKFIAERLVNCKHLYDVLVCLADFLGLLRGQNSSYRLRDQGRDIRIVIEPNNALVINASNDTPETNCSLGLDNQAFRNDVACWLRFISWFVGRHVACSISAAREQSGELPYVTIQNKYLSLPVVKSLNDVDGFLNDFPITLLREEREQIAFSAKITNVLNNWQGVQDPGVAEVASFFGVSPTTIHRKLSDESVRFQTIKDECRKQKCLEYMSCEELSLAQISLLLGFDHVSTFSRLFKRWMGIPPGEYRQKLQPLGHSS